MSPGFQVFEESGVGVKAERACAGSAAVFFHRRLSLEIEFLTSKQPLSIALGDNLIYAKSATNN